MRLQRGFTNKEWKEIGEKYKDGGVHMYRGKKTFFYTGEELWEENENEDEEDEGWPSVYDYDERNSWEVMIVLPGVTVIPQCSFNDCKNIKVVIMADTVRRIEWSAFHCCLRLEFVKLSRNLEFVGNSAFYSCEALVSIFIPPSCRQIGIYAFSGCEKLIILGLPPHVELGERVFGNTALIKKSPFETGFGYYNSDDEEEAVRWVKSINNGEAYSLHRACASFNPIVDIIHDLVKRQGIESMRMKNAIGITPSQYLEANTFADISEKEIVNKYILDMMGEIV